MNSSKKGKKSYWLPPDNYKSFFSAASDEAFKAEHPVGYVFLVVLLLIALLTPPALFCILVRSESAWSFLGFAGGFIVGIGLSNFVAIIIKQYLGHLVSLLSFLIGGILMIISWNFCR